MFHKERHSRNMFIIIINLCGRKSTDGVPHSVEPVHHGHGVGVLVFLLDVRQQGVGCGLHRIRIVQQLLPRLKVADVRQELGWVLIHLLVSEVQTIGCVGWERKEQGMFKSV